MGYKIYQVDAFTSTRFKGNPAAVCILPGPQEDHWMQNVAKEMNLSETAFVYKLEEGYCLRWFTPAVEVPLCGHATLSTAHILWSEKYLDLDQEVKFQTKSGELTAAFHDDWIILNFPAQPAVATTPPAGLLEVLGVEPKYIGKNSSDYLVEIDSVQKVKNLRINYADLAQTTKYGVIVTSRGDSANYDFVSRVFAPCEGINEDPVTGSAHCCLGPYWQKKLGKSEFTAYQASERGGVVKVRVAGERVWLKGQAITVLKGELTC